MNDLLASLDRDPSNLETWLIYADQLNEAGDARGELITIDCALDAARPEERPALLFRRQQLYDQHGPALLGPIGSQAVEAGFLSVVWQRGFVRELAYTGRPGWAHKRAVGWLVEVLAGEPYRFLESLDLSYTDITDISRLPALHLTKLLLRGTPISNIVALDRCGKLKTIDLNATSVPGEQVDAFRLARPDVVVIALRPRRRSGGNQSRTPR